MVSARPRLEAQYIIRRVKGCHAISARRLTLLVISFSDGRDGREVVSKFCGTPEDPRFEYEDGCDTIDIPYETEKCYCREDLCNGAAIPSAGAAVALFVALTAFIAARIQC